MLLGNSLSLDVLIRSQAEGVVAHFNNQYAPINVQLSDSPCPTPGDSELHDAYDRCYTQDCAAAASLYLVRSP